MRFEKSKKHFDDALSVMPGGVSSPVRAYRAVGGHPLFIRRGSGSKLYDEDGNGFIDYVMSWGALMLGHADPSVVRAIRVTAGRGTSYGAPTRQETQLCRLISAAIPSIERLRLVNSGTEATMSAIRLSRGFTGRDKIVKFEGCYHGHSDGLLVRAGSGAMTCGVPDSAGVPRGIADETIVCPYNDIDRLASVIRERHREIACVIVEPVCANMGVVLPREGFLAALRELTAANGIVLIFDEVITGFRLTYGGAQKLYGVNPDLTCLGKIIGGGLPIGAYGGRAEIMERLAPQGPVYQAGTLAGNPIAVNAGIAALTKLARLDYRALDERTQELCDAMVEGVQREGLAFTLNRAGSMFTIFSTSCEVADYQTASLSDTAAYARYFWSMLKRGIHLPPSQFEANFLSFKHSKGDIKQTISSHNKSMRAAGRREASPLT
ncbi:MAG: glutamate-1-semialdehyde 2,1-aminomutase [bacterium]